MIFRSNGKEKNILFYSTSSFEAVQLLERRCAETRTFENTFFFFVFSERSHPVARGARHASRRRELSTGVQVTGFLILLLPCKWERADLWQKVGIWRRIELDAALAASPRQITRKKKGGKKGKGQKGGRERGAIG